MARQLISPFDPAAKKRLQQMALISETDQVNAETLEAVSVVHAALFFSQILDACGDWDGTISICRRLVSQAALVSDRQVLLLISIQYDMIAKPLPEVIWWISGSELLLSPFVRGFVHRLDELCGEEEALMGGDVL